MTSSPPSSSHSRILVNRGGQVSERSTGPDFNCSALTPRVRNAPVMPKWNRGWGGASSSNHNCLPQRRTVRIFFPLSALETTAPIAPLKTIGSRWQ